MFSFFDVILIITVAGFTFFGFWFGFLHALTSLISFVVGTYISGLFYEPIAQWLVGFTGWSENAARIVAFLIIFSIVTRLLSFLLGLLEKVLDVVKIIPFVKTINRLLGLIFGLIEGIATIGLIVFMLERFPISEFIMQSLANSAIAPYASIIGAVLVPLLPEGIKLLDSSVNYVENVVKES